jgi:restriction system protein
MDGLFKVFLLLAVVSAFPILLRVFLPSFKTVVGELIVRHRLQRALPASHYTILHDVTLETDRGATQIDHVVVSPYGIFVIETRHMPGWISGSERDAQWTQTFFRSKTRIQNPLQQNSSHIKVLQQLLGLDTSKFHSLVVFTGNARFKTQMPINVTRLGGLLPFMQIRTKLLIDYDEASRIAELIESRRLSGDLATTMAHFALPKAAAGVVLMAGLTLIASQALKNDNDVPGAAPDALASSPYVQDAPAPKINLPAVKQQTAERLADK